MAKLLIVYHSQSGHTEGLAAAVLRGARHDEIQGVEIRYQRAAETDEKDLLWADGYLFGTPENFGYMSGAMKDLLDRTYYAVEGKLAGRPYAIFISCANDGRGAAAAIHRILNGYALKEVADPLICRGRPKPEHAHDAEELGMTMAAGLEAGVF